ncbi:MAG: hypothetical protein ISS51_01970 [Dehalococcoidales bacterium]|nr:hypothetical protein [Dehalococcoidales bacterium]
MLIAVSSTLFLIDTPSPVLAQYHGGDDGGDYGGYDGSHDGDGGHGGGDGGDGDGHNGGDDSYYYDDYYYSESFLRTEVPEGQELGPVQNVRDWDGTIFVTADGYPVLGRQLFDSETGLPILDYSDNWEGEPIYFTNTGEGWMSPRVTSFYELGPGMTSGPGNDRFLFTPRPDSQDDQTQDSPSPGRMSPSETQGGEPSPSETFRDDTRFGEPQPVMGPTGNPLVDEDGAPVLGRVALDEEGNPVIGPNGNWIIVIPD